MKKRHGHGAGTGFTLIELLVGIVIITTLTGIIVGSMRGISDSTGFDNNLSSLSNILQTSRSYAMANNTYVFVGIQEINGFANTTPASPGNGTLALAVVASADGTLPTTKTSPATYTALSSSKVNIVLPLTLLRNIHIAATPLSVPSKPAAFNPSGVITVMLPASSYTALPFTWPLSGTAVYSFGMGGGTSQVLVINPQGSIQLIPTTATPSLPHNSYDWIEIDLQPTHGTTLPSANATNNAVIIIDGVNGNISLYR